MFETSSPKTRAVNSAALMGAVTGAVLSLLVIARIGFSDDFRGGGVDYLLGALLGGLVQGIITAVFAGVGALAGLLIASSQRLPGENEFASGQSPLPLSIPPQVPAGWHPDPAGQPRQRYSGGVQWTEHSRATSGGA